MPEGGHQWHLGPGCVTRPWNSLLQPLYGSIRGWQLLPSIFS